MWMWLWNWLLVARWYDNEILLVKFLSSSHLRPRLRACLVSIPPVDTMGLAVGRCYRFSRGLCRWVVVGGTFESGVKLCKGFLNSHD